MEFTVK
jgi:serine protease Do